MTSQTVPLCSVSELSGKAGGGFCLGPDTWTITILDHHNEVSGLACVAF